MSGYVDADVARMLLADFQRRGQAIVEATERAALDSGDRAAVAALVAAALALLERERERLQRALDRAEYATAQRLRGEPGPQ